jgi:hypothetical protein
MSKRSWIVAKAFTFLCPRKFSRTPHNRFDRLSVGLPRSRLCTKVTGAHDAPVQKRSTGKSLTA